jgi:hypothetical protein
VVLVLFLGICFFSAQEADAMMMPQASGTTEYKENRAVIDASNTGDGYFMVKYDGTSSSRLKVLITGPKGTEFNFDLDQNGNFEVFPLSDGNGSYSIGVYQNTGGTKYTTLLSKKISVNLNNEFAPFLIPNQYVNYTSASKTVKMGAELAGGGKTSLEKITAVYDYVSTNISYDKQKAATVQSGYVPDVDQILDIKKGICFDFASVMASMLRSQDVPTRLVVGYAGTAYHAWLDVYSAETGWIETVVFFDGKSWKLMDPTFASGFSSGAALAQYIGDGTKYKPKYYG